MTEKGGVRAAVPGEVLPGRREHTRGSAGTGRVKGCHFVM